MNKLLILTLILSLSPTCNAKNRGKDFGVTFGATALGSTVGTAIGNAISKPSCAPAPRQEVVVVREVHHVPVRKRKLERIEARVRSELAELKSRKRLLERELNDIEILVEEKEKTLNRISKQKLDIDDEIAEIEVV